MSKAVIAGGHQVTCDVASEILKSGGNVIDAAIAALSTMFISEPAMASAGGGAFATVAMNGEEPCVFDFFCQTPLVKKPKSVLEFKPIIVDFGDDQELFYSGNGSSAVPGTIAGIYALHEKYGQMPIKELFQPATQHMKTGVALDAFQYYDLSLLKEIFLDSPFGRDIFGQNGDLKEEGEKIRMPQLADFMEVLAIEGKDLFYRGEAGQELVNQHAESGGLITMDDLANYSLKIRKPASFHKWNWHFHTVPFPFLGGPLIQLMLGKIPSMEEDFGERMKILSKVFLDVVSIQKDRKALIKALGKTQLPDAKHSGSTSHFSIVDVDGNAVSLTTSIGEGSGLFLPSSGIHMNNMLGELALLPGDLHSWQANQRLNSRMSPMIAKHDNGDILALGTGGAGRIPYVLAQFIFHWVATYPQSQLPDLLDWPRLFCTDEMVHVETPLKPEELQTNNLDSKVWSAQSLFFGGINAVAKTGNKLEAAADNRRIGFTKYI